MIVERSVHPGWLSNSWLVAAAPGGDAVVVDAGAPSGPLMRACERLRLRVTHVLDTHHHPDHVAENGAWVQRHGAQVCAHEAERELVPHCTRALADGEVVASGGLAIRALFVPGHTRGQLNFVVGDSCFTGDTLFAGSVGGTRGPGHGTFEELRTSILERLMTLPAATRVRPGHGPETTIGHERETNPFVRAWRGLDAPSAEPCRASGRPATLLTWARDYDGGHKAWVRFEDGSEDVVPGSRVERSPPA